MAKRGALFKAMQRHFRKRRFKMLISLIREMLSQNERVRILDAGGRSVYWKMLPEDLRPRLDVVVLNSIKELERYDIEISGLNIVTTEGDACRMPQFGDGEFDIVHANSVIEHVGSYQNMIHFAAECRRVGSSYFIQTPHFWFPVEPHYGVPFVHWLPDVLRILLFTKMNVGYVKKCSYEDAVARVDHTKIIDRRMMRKLFPDGKIINERLLLLVKSVTVVRRQFY